jgi:predicted nucleotidyltransferase
MLSKSTIQAIADDVVKHFNPEKIILFGSYARNDVNEHSDLDLLVVMNCQAPRGQRSAPILRMLAEHYAEPIDIVVHSPEHIKAWKDRPGSFVQQALSEGIVLYDKQEQSV